MFFTSFVIFLEFVIGKNRNDIQSTIEVGLSQYARVLRLVVYSSSRASPCFPEKFSEIPFEIQLRNEKALGALEKKDPILLAMPFKPDKKVLPLAAKEALAEIPLLNAPCSRVDWALLEPFSGIPFEIGLFKSIGSPIFISFIKSKPFYY